MFARYHKTVQRLLAEQKHETHWRHNDPASLAASFVRLRQMLTRLGNPEATMRYIHVTGTSGKGSVTALIHDMLLAAEGPERSRREHNRGVASYTSPHTTTLLERFRVNEKLIAPDALCDAIDIVLAAHTKHRHATNSPLSFFELTTCIAFVAFRNAHVEWCVLEVGLGGRWDSTNIIPKKDVAVITNIDLDHTDVLGNALSKIAYEKAGIITTPCTVICGEPRKSLQRIFTHAAKAVSASISFVTKNEQYQDLTPSHELASHLLQNIAIASAAARAVGVSQKAIAGAIKNHKRLPCRFEIMQSNPTIILDGAHNVAKIKATLNQILQPTRYNLQPFVIIFGCKQDKDAKKMLAVLAKHASIIHTTQYTHGRGKPMDPNVLLTMVPKAKRGKTFAHAHDALHFASHLQAPTYKLQPALILITGSLYLAGELRTHWVTENDILKNQSSEQLPSPHHN